MKPKCFVLGTVFFAISFATNTLAQKESATLAPQFSRACATEGGIQVCRDAVAAPAEPSLVAKEAPAQGKLLFLLDIPAHIFARLAQSPEQNREFHPRQNWVYQAKPAAPPGAGKYDRERAPGPAAWQYRPKASFAYRPKEDWSYDPDVFSRLWISNIKHDTRAVETPIPTPGVYLIPLQDVR